MPDAGFTERGSNLQTDVHFVNSTQVFFKLSMKKREIILTKRFLFLF